MHGIEWTNTTKNQNQHGTKRPNDQGKSNQQQQQQSQPDRLCHIVQHVYTSQQWAVAATKCSVCVLCVYVWEKPLPLSYVVYARTSFSLSRDFFSVYHSDSIVHRTAQSLFDRQTVRTRFSFSSLATTFAFQYFVGEHKVLCIFCFLLIWFHFGLNMI